MGQAKQRGTYDERRKQAISRNEAHTKEQLRIAKERWDSLTPEQQAAEREKSRKRRRGLAACWAISLEEFGLNHTMKIPIIP